MNLPEPFIIQAKEIFENDFENFLRSLQQDAPTSIRLNDKIDLVPSENKVPWCSSGYYLPQRPLFTADPYFHSGAYYVQEASSMFLCQVLAQLVPNDSVVLDLSAAPGGKSTLISQFINEKGLLVSNEIIRSRANILTENMTKWGNDAVIVTNNAPKDFGKLSGFFDVVVVDAPCSGEGMFRKDNRSIEEWSKQNVTMCATRQKEILKDVWNALKTEGILIYSTCTYNFEENEKNIEWIEKELGAQFIPLNIENFSGIVSTSKGYRFFSHKIRGEGFFVAALRKINSDNNAMKTIKHKRQTYVKHPQKTEHLKHYLKNPQKWEIYTDNHLVSAFDKEKSEKLLAIKSQMRVLHFGIAMSEQKGKDFIPQTGLALSKHVDTKQFYTETIDYNTAISFLKKEIIFLSSAPVGFILLKYKGIPLGWVKNVGNRCNNLYPGEWKIRMNLPH
ncbi:MAG: methyltransferase RsmF C-terminal domain-like protein [Paludibacteraceae bacterium]